ncbi:MAG TPA: phosphate acyltransferase [Bryobacteraceae bacterium]|nr:phosphate acyltransferase [Bryobacteraceae bacterium]
MLTIAVDAMGGDNAPKAEVEGAIHAASELHLRVVLVGQEHRIRQELAKHSGAGTLPVEICHAEEIITMEDSAAKVVRTKKNSSIHVAARLVRDGEADGFVSAGNTGAVMATAKMIQGMIRGVQRPALASAFPTLKGTPVVVVDVGANVDCTPAMLAQFGVMGEIYSRYIFKIRSPRVGLLSIGEEEHKGNDLTRAATPLLKCLPLRFIGNVALKVSEGLVEMLQSMLRESLEATVTRKLGYVLSKEAYRDFRKRVDYAEYGGAPLLGVKGVSIICHGRSNANAIKNAIRVASEFAHSKINEKIEAELDRSAAKKVAVQ